MSLPRSLRLAFVTALVFTVPAWSLEGRPPVRGFGPDDFGAHPQCWSMVQDAAGRILVGNTSGLLTFDGVRWELDRLPNASAAVALARTEDGRVFAGASGALGRIERDDDDRAVFVDLVADIAAEDRPYGDVWDVVALGDEVFFATLEQVYRLDANERVHRLDPQLDADLDDVVLSLVVWRDALWVGVSGHGLYRWNGTGFDRAWAAPDPTGEDDAREPLEPGLLTDLVPLDDDRLVVLEQDRLWSFDGRDVAPLPTAIDSTVQEHWIYAGHAMADGSFFVGTVGSGAYRLDADGRRLEHWTAADGLPHDIVHAFGTDRDGGLWLCQEMGVARVDPEARVRRFPSVRGLLNDVLTVDGRTYALTSQGLYTADPDTGSAFEALVTDADFTAALATPRGVLIALSSGFVRRHDGAWSDWLDADYPIVLQHGLAGDGRVHGLGRDGLHVLDVTADSVSRRALLPLPHEGTSLAEPQAGEIWIGTREGRVMRARLDDEARAFAALDVLGAESGVPASYSFLAAFDGHVLLGSDEGMHFHGDGSFRPVPTSELQRGVVEQLVVVDDVLWALVDGTVGCLRPDRAGRGRWVWDDRLAWNHESGRIHAFAVDADRVWASRGSEIVRWSTADAGAADHAFLPSLRRVVASSGRDVVSRDERDGVRIGAEPGVVRFEFAGGSHRGENAPSFRSRLEGVDRTWTPWTRAPFREFQRLEPGARVLKIQARDDLGSLSDVLEVAVHVRPTWSQSAVGRATKVALMLAATVLLGWWVARLRSARIRARSRALEAVVDERTRDLAAANARLHASIEELSDVNATLARIDAERLRLLDVAAHDLKNPLGSILSTADALLEDPSVVKDHPDLVQLIHDASRRMLVRVDDMLEHASSEIATSSLLHETLDAEALARRVVDSQECRAALRRQTLRARSTTRSPGFVGDARRLRDALDELVEHAIAAAPEDSALVLAIADADDGGIRFAVQTHDADSAQAVEEWPSGHGTDRFRRIVQLHGGRAWCSDRVWGIDLPRRGPADADPPLRSAPTTGSRGNEAPVAGPTG